MKSNYMVPVALVIILTLVLQTTAASLPRPAEYQTGVVVITVEPETKIDIPLEGSTRTGNEIIDQFLEQIDAEKVERMFPHCLAPVPGGADLTVIYTVRFVESLSVMEICTDFSKVPGIKYAEPWYIDRICLDHNDPLRNRQYYLNLVEANNAHDISTGDPSAVVAIIDTGTDMDHPDLEDNLWVNPAEDLNGNGQIDQNERNDTDDGRNGYIDDFYGWDFFGNGQQGNNHEMDNDPNDGSGHGTHCSGLASAITNNRTGIASSGYSSSIMAVRVGHGLTVAYGYNGIEYAARNGADVISCSWGGYQGSQWAASVIEYAHDHDALVIAAAGNDNVNQDHYPSHYEFVVAVGATDQNDRKAGFSNYGDWVDISAPGVGILSTVPGGGYQIMDGTSMACPIVAGVAVLIRGAYPFLDVDEARQVLLDGADDIDDNLGNRAGLMGVGRANAFESLLLRAMPDLAMADEIEIFEDDDDNHRLDPGEAASLAVTITNGEYGIPTESLVVTLTTEDQTLELDVNRVEFPQLDPGSSFTNEDDPFMIQISEETVPHTTFLTLTIEAQPGDIVVEYTFEKVIGHPDILVVDDDNGAKSETWLFESIEEANQGWARWEVEKLLPPDLITLTDYRMVIWLTGHAESPLDDLDRFQMEMGLAEGANILLIGNKIGNDPENHSILRNYFGARHGADSVRAMTVRGIDQKPIAPEVQLYLYNRGEEGDGRDSPSTMSLVNDSDSLCVYYLGDDPVGLAGVTKNDYRLEAHRAYLGFAFESVNDMVTPRHVVMEQLYNWFMSPVEEPGENVIGFEPGNIQTFMVNPAFPNPFNSTVRLSFNLPHQTAYQIFITDLRGRQMAQLYSPAGQSGVNQMTWNAEGLPSGLYFAQITVPGLAPVQQKLYLIK